VIAALALGAVLAAPAAAQVGLGLAPMRMELRLAAGAQQSGVLTLVNDSVKRTRVVADLLDFQLDSTATPQFEKQLTDEKPFSCRQWLSVNPMDFELEPNQPVQARFTVRVPAGATERSHHCAIGFTSAPTSDEVKGMGLRAAVQVVSAFYVVVGNPKPDGALKDLKLEYYSDPKKPGWRAVVVIGNPSLMHFRPQGDLDVLDEGGQVVESVKFVPLPVLPQRDQRFLFPLELSGGPGKYVLRARVDLGMNEIQEATAHVVAAKPAP
jgi:hypothetical protein